jgi:hypothetical protein
MAIPLEQQENEIQNIANFMQLKERIEKIDNHLDEIKNEKLPKFNINTAYKNPIDYYHPAYIKGLLKAKELCSLDLKKLFIKICEINSQEFKEIFSKLYKDDVDDNTA